jgi:hypothetical protein
VLAKAVLDCKSRQFSATQDVLVPPKDTLNTNGVDLSYDPSEHDCCEQAQCSCLQLKMRLLSVAMVATRDSVMHPNQPLLWSFAQSHRLNHTRPLGARPGKADAHHLSPKHCHPRGRMATGNSLLSFRCSLVSSASKCKQQHACASL